MSIATVVVLVTLAGAAGSLLRHEVTARAGPAGSAPRAAAVAAVNLGGTAVLGVLLALAVPTPVLTVVGVGFCGALTTFSGWVVDAALAPASGRRVVTVAAFDLAAQFGTGVLVVVAAGRLIAG